MRYLITIVIAAFSLNAFGQGIPQLPWNPDENGDGLIGVPDLQGLLSQYGLEFNSAVLSEDEESALVYVGYIDYFLCHQACENLPGFWHMSTLGDLCLLSDTDDVNQAWVKTDYQGGDPFAYLINSNKTYYKTNNGTGPMGCYCAAHELPKVEYSYCSEISAGFNDCISSKVQDGWYPLGGLSSDGLYNNKNQAFWRWAE
jgi:hypothetical protein